MKIRFVKLLVVVPLILTGVLTGCSKKRVELFYPDYGYANADSDSWTQIGADEEVITINWFTDASSLTSNLSPDSKVGKYILEKTKVKINWQNSNNDPQAIRTMIAANTLPDVVAVSAGSSHRFRLPLDGYVYPIDTLAEKYAPTLLNRIDPSVRTCYEMNDGKVYAIPNHFYTDADMEAYKQQEGQTIISNGAILARKDLIDEYIAAKKKADSNWTDVEATTPSGFIEMCRWAKNKLGNSYNKNQKSKVLLSEFDLENGSNGVRWLSQYFCTPREDADGNLVGEKNTAQYKEAILFLNTLYNEGIISKGNFSIKHDGIVSEVNKGSPFVFIGSPQDYEEQFKNAALKGKEYVPIVLTNSNGDVPQLTSLAGKGGWRCAMITNKCSHPERVIKLFDFLVSEEGQSLFFGIKDQDYTYEINPGGKDDNNKTYKYGRIKWSEQAWTDIQNKNTSGYGFMYSNPLINPMYPRLAGPNGEILNTYANYVLYNSKAALTDYVYSGDAFSYVRDPEHKKYEDMINIASSLNILYNNKLAKIITADSNDKANSAYDSMVKEAKGMGSEKLLSFDNEMFKAYKQKLGISYGFPPNDPNSGYSQLSVTSLFGNPDKYNKDIPTNIVRK
jgi:putative aldouronate transport system substrate-binding protein